mgnify:FL=1
MMPIIADAILKINPSAQVVVRGHDLDTCEIEWLEGTSEISKADIQTKLDELQVQYDNNEYQRKRDAEYPSIKDQLDKIYHEGIDKWKEDMIKPVKDKHPKD